MEDLIELYLFQYKNCPLPLIGTLEIKDGTATNLYSQDKIAAPVPHISLNKNELPTDHFIEFIAVQKNISGEEASKLLDQYCMRLHSMPSYEEKKLEHAGKFYIDPKGELVFKQAEITNAYTPPIPTHRVKHPNAVHTMTVGDTETTSAVMTEYYTESEKSKKEKWWITALILFLVSAAAIFIYFNDARKSASYGNAAPIETKPVIKTYDTSK